jgi:UDPglucose--hexose-1-phosphate uridylyltransferase
MSEIRQNLATKEWVIIATERAKRPEQFVQKDKEKAEDRPPYAADCPFCPGNEELDLEQLRLPSTGDWQVRVVRNRYPALQESGERIRRLDGVHRSISGIGHHDVIVESRLHNVSPAYLPLESIELTLQTFQQRALTLDADPRVEHIVFFKNHGPSAGTSLLHPHCQMLALPMVPYTVRSRIEEARRHHDDHGECVFCRMRAEEERDGARVLLKTPLFTAFVPYAAYSPFHVWIMPVQHRACFHESSAEELRDLAALMSRLLKMIHVGLNDPDFNYVIRSAPRQEQHAPYLHWYLAMVPRVSQSAGFELGTGMFINTALPEDSARFLRSVGEQLHRL